MFIFNVEMMTIVSSMFMTMEEQADRTFQKHLVDRCHERSQKFRHSERTEKFRTNSEGISARQATDQNSPGEWPTKWYACTIASTLMAQ